ncbi:MAG: hypothetical protein ACRDPR_03075, partial [Nocardioidaceae bacterium]
MIAALAGGDGGVADALLVTAPVLAPVAAAATAALMGWRRAVGWMTVGAAAVILAAGGFSATRTVDGAALTAGGWLRIDA